MNIYLKNDSTGGSSEESFIIKGAILQGMSAKIAKISNKLALSYFYDIKVPKPSFIKY